MSEKKPEQGTTAFKKWYDNNKKEFNAKRRARYHKDKEYREKAQENSKRRREVKATAKPAPGPEVREHNGEEVLVYTVVQASERIGRSTATIRSWERRGLIPKPIFPGHARRYTKNQIDLLASMVAEADKHTSKHEQNRVYVDHVRTLETHWGD